ncbi:MAG: hypothetical protein AB7E66_14560 [Parvibaculaceae bacterium]
MPIEFADPWRALDASAERETLQRRYENEVSGSHPLASLEGQIIGRSDASDDVMVRLNDKRFAVVHLTWSIGDPHWTTSFTVYASEEAASQRIAEDSTPSM